MVSPATLAGLLASYTVGAIVTAIALTKDLTPAAVPTGQSPAAGDHRAAVACAAVDRNRRVMRCLRSFDESRPLTALRR